MYNNIIVRSSFVQLAGGGERFVMVVTCCCKCRPYRVSCVGSFVVEINTKVYEQKCLASVEFLEFYRNSNHKFNYAETYDNIFESVLCTAI